MLARGVLRLLDVKDHHLMTVHVAASRAGYQWLKVFRAGRLKIGCAVGDGDPCHRNLVQFSQMSLEVLASVDLFYYPDARQFCILPLSTCAKFYYQPYFFPL